MKDEKGQAVLIIILVMAVMGVVTISVANNAVSGLRVQQIGNESINALMGAEAALEKALKAGDDIIPTTDVGNNVSYSASHEIVGETGFMTNEAVEPGNVVQIFTLPTTGSIRLYFMSPAAVKIAEYWGSSPNYGVTYYTVDSTSRGNNFDDQSALGKCIGYDVEFADGNFTFNCYKDIVLNNISSRFVRVTVLYANSRIGVGRLSGDLPRQKDIINASGTVNLNSNNAQISRKIIYTQLGKRLPSIFDSVLFTNSNLTQ